VFEEEDFQPLVYGFRLATEVAEQKAISAIKESEEELVKEMKIRSTNESSEEVQELKVSELLLVKEKANNAV
jgi:hypothetical protein